jgi:hypothetical protein
VSQGEHLCQIADLIARARSATERDLRLYHLIGALRSANSPGPDPVAGALAVFARSTREALAAGMASQLSGELVVNLKAAGELLRSVADAGDRMQVSRRILDVAHKLDQARLGTGESAPAAPGPVETDIVPIESLQFDAVGDGEADVVPIATLAPDPAPSDPDASGLEASFRTLERLQRERGPAPASLDALVEHTVDIGSLCYRGRSALERAATVRGTLAAELAGVADLAAIRPLLQELLDLVPLALDDS